MIIPKEFISVLIPTYNESENIGEILRRTKVSLDSVREGYEIIVIDDDSVDNTADIAEKFLGDRGRVIRRKGVKSLSLSVLGGINEAAGTIIVVMDADASHPPELIPEFVEEFRKGNDLVVASRYVKGASTRDFPLLRKIFSRLACFIGGLVTNIKDNTSGFFCLRKSALEDSNLTPQGFKIGLEIFVKANFVRYKEIPYTFVNRRKGKSKFSLKPLVQYALQVFYLLIYRIFKKRNDKSIIR